MSRPTQTVKGMPLSARTSIQASIASRAFSRASARVAPWLTHPGIAGHSTIHIPSSPRVIEVTKFINEIIGDAGVDRKPDSTLRALSADHCHLTTANCPHLLVPLHALRKEAA